ncbi:MAG: hypothetical protein KAY32_12860 [Candidatus Eisenbacteria sp.]|nr:hypothetical protein [Candidatus Eisenbacteria bacterium]
MPTLERTGEHPTQPFNKARILFTLHRALLVVCFIAGLGIPIVNLIWAPPVHPILGILFWALVLLADGMLLAAGVMYIVGAEPKWSRIIPGLIIAGLGILVADGSAFVQQTVIHRVQAAGLDSLQAHLEKTLFRESSGWNDNRLAEFLTPRLGDAEIAIAAVNSILMPADVHYRDHCVKVELGTLSGPQWDEAARRGWLASTRKETLRVWNDRNHGLTHWLELSFCGLTKPPNVPASDLFSAESLLVLVYDRHQELIPRKSSRWGPDEATGRVLVDPDRRSALLLTEIALGARESARVILHSKGWEKRGEGYISLRVRRPTRRLRLCVVLPGPAFETDVRFHHTERNRQAVCLETPDHQEVLASINGGVLPYQGIEVYWWEQAILPAGRTE